MTIGYIPEEKVNKLTWIPVTNPQRWATKVYSIKVGNKTMDPMEIMYEREVIFDSASARLLLAPAMVNELKNQLKALDQRGGLYRCDAEYLMNYPNMTVDVKNMTIILNVYSYLYFGQPMNRLGQNYCELAVTESPTIVLGVSFFRNNFMAFSKRNQTIGIYQEERPIVLSTELTKATQVSLVFLVLFIIVIVALLIENVVDWVKKKVIKEPLNQGQENFDTMTA